MRIQHNIAALNSYRQLSENNNTVSKNLEKLSSGYRINRAGDDAAGLAISEKMRAQITGLETAQKNANDGISLVQTAEGALTEVHAMLNRMTELASQSANGTYDDNVDRANLQKEFDSLLDEVDRISEATNFNGIKLLDGSLGGAEVQTTQGTKATEGSAAQKDDPQTVLAPTVKGTPQNGNGNGIRASITFDFKNCVLKAPKEGYKNGLLQVRIGRGYIMFPVKGAMSPQDFANGFKDQQISIDMGAVPLYAKVNDDATVTFTAADDTTTFGIAITADITYTPGQKPAVAHQTGTASTATIDFGGSGGGSFLGSKVQIGDKTYAFVNAGSSAPTEAGVTNVEIRNDFTGVQLAKALAEKIEADGIYDVNFTDGVSKLTIVEKGVPSTDPTAAAGTKDYSGEAIKVKFSGTGLQMQVGDTDDEYQKVRVSIGDMSMQGLGLSALKGSGIARQTSAGSSIEKIKAAINTVSATRGDLGAIQNRLEHTINNLGAASENMTAAESRIRDTDMAEEMMSYTKNSILVQAAQAMLAQANQVPQGILQMLQ